ncbi:hypothetical protein DAPPUDRAFT_303375 [Daphnia pulex]|uniref:AMP-dependent synthetase/ligase domain-containing protein n=1 Tax=Daphnia pulex TaxID=6669 RepID=E9HQM0_DAPPU|nr:hypothetical protein DAPPUDRAFT_303375 [Daphnia pulex]|eukprot:EFX65951.1 hypothetical protein DAPPUDRAFT_303375 [Daphnia pulex]
MSMHLRSSLRRAHLLANKTNICPAASISSQNFALGSAIQPVMERSPSPKECRMRCFRTSIHLQHGLMSQAARRFGSALTRMGFKKDDVMGIVSPNVPEFSIAMFGSAGAGMPVALVNPAYTADEIARQMTLVGATALFGVAEMTETLKGVAQLCPTIQRVILLGLPKNVMLTHSTVGKNVQQYLHPEGTNNRPATVMMSPLGNKKLGSCGALFSRTQAKVMDLETGERALGLYEDGELFVTGPQVMKGYYKNQKATDKMIRADGWLRTGDVGHYDEDGHFFIVDWLKELIKVAPAELEEILTTHPAIKEAAVIGIPDERAGELPRAYIVKKPGMESVSDFDIHAFIDAKVSATSKSRAASSFAPQSPGTTWARFSDENCESSMSITLASKRVAAF